MNMKVTQIILLALLMFSFSHVAWTQEKNITEGVKLFEIKNYSDAERYFTKLSKKTPNRPQALYYLGLIKMVNNEFKQANKFFKACVAIAPDNAEYWSQLGISYFKQVDNSGIFSIMSLLRHGRKSLEKSLRLDSTNIYTLKYLSSFYVIAPSIVGGNLKEGRKLALKLLALDEVEGRLVLLKVMVKEDKPNKVHAEYKRLAEQVGNNSKYADFYLDYGYFLLEEKNFQEAVVQFEMLTQLKPEDANSHDSLGDGYYQAGRLQDARLSYKKALSIDAEFSSSKKNLKKVEKKLRKLS